MSTLNSENTTRQRGRQPGQKVWSMDFRAFRALNSFDFEAHGIDISGNDKDKFMLALIEHLREADIF